MMNAQLNWHVVYTRPNHETKVALLLKQKGMKIYSPRNPIIQKGSQQPGTTRYLFPRWVFVCCTQEQLATLRNVYGVINVLHWHNKPAVISQEDISTLKYVLNGYADVHLQKTGIKPFESTESLPKPKNSFALPSLGYTLYAQSEIKTSNAYLSDFAVENTTSVSQPLRYAGGVHAILRKIPFLLGRKITEFPVQ